MLGRDCADARTGRNPLRCERCKNTCAAHRFPNAILAIARIEGTTIERLSKTLEAKVEVAVAPAAEALRGELNRPRHSTLTTVRLAQLCPSARGADFPAI
jgi:hypothetical protein